MKTDAHAKPARIDYSSDIYMADSTSIRTSAVRFQAVKEHLCCELKGEAVILNLKNGKYYGLNPVASRIWELIQEPLPLAEIESSILREYDVEEAVCQEQVATFLKQMATENLVETVDETTSELI